MADNDQKDASGSSESETAVPDSPDPDAAPGQSSASDWDMNRTKPSGDPGPKPEHGEPFKGKPGLDP